MVVDYAVMGMTHSLVVLLIARIIGGFASATHSTAFAAMADLSPPEKRSAAFGLIGAAFGLGFVLGPTIGGLLGEFGTRAPFWAAAVLAALNTILGLLAFPETIKPENRRRFRLREANPFSAFLIMTRVPGIRRGLAIMFLYHVAFAVYPSVWAFFGHAQFGWSSAIIGTTIAIAIPRSGTVERDRPTPISTSTRPSRIPTAPSAPSMRLSPTDPAKTPATTASRMRPERNAARVHVPAASRNDIVRISV